MRTNFNLTPQVTPASPANIVRIDQLGRSAFNVYTPGEPTGGSFTIHIPFPSGTVTTAAIPFNADWVAFGNAIAAVLPADVTLTINPQGGGGTFNTDTVMQIAFTPVRGGPQLSGPITATSSLTGGIQPPGAIVPTVIDYHLPGASQLELALTSGSLTDSGGHDHTVLVYLGKGNPPDYDVDPPLTLTPAADSINQTIAFDSLRLVIPSYTPQTQPVVFNIATATPEDVGAIPVVTSVHERATALAAQRAASQQAAAQVAQQAADEQAAALAAAQQAAAGQQEQSTLDQILSALTPSSS